MTQVLARKAETSFMKLIGLLVFLTQAAWAEGIAVLPRSPVTGTSFQQWTRAFANRLNTVPTNQRSQHGECREITEVPGTILCLVNDIPDVARFQGRASLFAEGAGVIDGRTVGRGTLADRNSAIARLYAQNIGGTDIRSEDLTAFYRRVEFACDCPSGCDSTSLCQSANTCLDESEREFYEKVIAPAERLGRPFTVIMAPYQMGIIAAHEVLHAQYFNQASYRQAVDDFWNTQMTSAQRQAVTEALAEGYDRTDSFLIRNEFQAYAFKSEGSPFAHIGEDYGAALANYLRQRGVSPILINE